MKTKVKKQVARKAASKKRRSNNAPSAKARSKQARKRNSAGEVKSPTRTEVRSPTRTSTATKAYTAGNVTVTGGAGAGATTRVSIHSNGKKNGAVVRRKYKNGYLDLVIAGTARRGAKGWRIGGKEIPYGKGIVPIKAGHYLDRGTGQVFSRRVRNIAAGAYYDGAFHPFRSSSDYDPAIAGETGKKPQHTRSKKKKLAVKKAIRTASDKKATKSRRATTSRLAMRSLQRSTPLKRQRQKRNPSEAASQAIRDRKDFAGHFGKLDNLWFPYGTPEGLSKLGELYEMKLVNGSKVKIDPKSELWLCQDTRHKLHIGSTKKGSKVMVPPGNYGEINSIEYIEAKPHVGEPHKVIWVHKMGEVTGERPDFVVNADGQPLIKGGAYSINWRGIQN